MRGKLIVAAAVGILVGLMFPLMAGRQDARGQKQGKLQQWEYQVVFCDDFEVSAGPEVETKTKRWAQDLAHQLNDASDHGWEYVGPLAQLPRNSHPEGGYADGAYVVFRRPKP